MASINDFNNLVKASNTLTTLGTNHSSLSTYIGAQLKMVKNSAEQMISGYSIYGFEFADLGNLINTVIPGLTSPATNLEEPSTNKIIEQPFAGSTVQDRLTFYGHVPPQMDATDSISPTSLITDPGIGSLLPWTPHPQHSYQMNSTRVINRTGKERSTGPNT